MNYQRHYDNLIIRARSRVLDGYVERHHVLPVCLGGSNKSENLVILTPEEHYTAHLLLAKIYSKDARLLYAANMMVVNNPSQHRTQNKMYGWLRKAVDEAQRLRRPSEETREKLRISRKGKKPNLGRVTSDDTKAKLSKAGILRYANTSLEQRQEAAAKSWATKKANGYFVKPETGQKISNALKGSTMLADKVAAMTPEQRSAKTHKAWITRRSNITMQTLQYRRQSWKAN